MNLEISPRNINLEFGNMQLDLKDKGPDKMMQGKERRRTEYPALSECNIQMSIKGGRDSKPQKTVGGRDSKGTRESEEVGTAGKSDVKSGWRFKMRAPSVPSSTAKKLGRKKHN